MPYNVRPAPEGAGFEVVNTATGDVKSKHADRAEAERQKQLLEEIEGGMDPGKES